LGGRENVKKFNWIINLFQMMESGVLKILAFQYECFAEITEDTYLKFLTNFSALATAVKVCVFAYVFIHQPRHLNQIHIHASDYMYAYSPSSQIMFKI
jgi:hypothetical protein